MTAQIRFLTTNYNVRLAYCTSGSGKPLVVVPSWISHLELDHQALVGPEFFRELESNNTLIRYDKRGMGLSQRNIDDFSLDAQVSDLAALIEHLDLRDVTLFGSSQGGVIAVAYATSHPERVSRLILYGTYHRIPDEVRTALGAVLPLIRTDWTGLGTAPMLEFFVPGASPEMRDFFARYQREAATASDAAGILEALASYEITSLLAEINVPTLVIHRRDDTAVSVDQGRDIAAAIPTATFVAVDGQVHLPYWGDVKPILEAIKEFMPGPQSATKIPSAFRTILFTDLVGHSEMMSRLGDTAGRAVLREHEETTRRVLVEYGGTEVKTMGDGFMASFGSVTAAVACAIALQRAFTAHVGEPLTIRVGINAGEPIEEDGDLFGASVILASRIAARATAGEILVADTVRGLCSGKGFLFADRGDFVAKGFEEPVHIYEVNWRE